MAPGDPPDDEQPSQFETFIVIRNPRLTEQPKHAFHSIISGYQCVPHSEIWYGGNKGGNNYLAWEAAQRRIGAQEQTTPLAAGALAWPQNIFDGWLPEEKANNVRCGAARALPRKTPQAIVNNAYTARESESLDGCAGWYFVVADAQHAEKLEALKPRLLGGRKDTVDSKPTENHLKTKEFETFVICDVSPPLTKSEASSVSRALEEICARVPERLNEYSQKTREFIARSALEMACPRPNILYMPAIWFNGQQVCVRVNTYQAEAISANNPTASVKIRSDQIQLPISACVAVKDIPESAHVFAPCNLNAVKYTEVSKSFKFTKAEQQHAVKVLHAIVTRVHNRYIETGMVKTFMNTLLELAGGGNSGNSDPGGDLFEVEATAGSINILASKHLRSVFGHDAFNDISVVPTRAALLRVIESLTVTFARTGSIQDSWGEACKRADMEETLATESVTGPRHRCKEDERSQSVHLCRFCKTLTICRFLVETSEGELICPACRLDRNCISCAESDDPNQCDGAKPSCSTCIDKEKDCVYADASRRRQYKRTMDCENCRDNPDASHPCDRFHPCTKCQELKIECLFSRRKPDDCLNCVANPDASHPCNRLLPCSKCQELKIECIFSRRKLTECLKRNDCLNCIANPDASHPCNRLLPCSKCQELKIECIFSRRKRDDCLNCVANPDASHPCNRLTPCSKCQELGINCIYVAEQQISRQREHCIQCQEHGDECDDNYPTCSRCLELDRDCSSAVYQNCFNCRHDPEDCDLENPVCSNCDQDDQECFYEFQCQLGELVNVPCIVCSANPELAARCDGENPCTHCESHDSIAECMYDTPAVQRILNALEAQLENEHNLSGCAVPENSETRFLDRVKLTYGSLSFRDPYLGRVFQFEELARKTDGPQRPFLPQIDALNPISLANTTNGQQRQAIHHLENLRLCSAIANYVKYTWSVRIIQCASLLLKGAIGEALDEILNAMSHLYLIRLIHPSDKAGRLCMSTETIRVYEKHSRTGDAEGIPLNLIERPWRPYHMANRRPVRNHHPDRALVEFDDQDSVNCILRDIEKETGVKFDEVPYVFNEANKPCLWQWADNVRFAAERLRVLSGGDGCNKHYSSEVTASELFVLQCLQWADPKRFELSDIVPAGVSSEELFWVRRNLEPYILHPMRAVAAHGSHGLNMTSGLSKGFKTLADFDMSKCNISWEPDFLNRGRGNWDDRLAEAWQALRQVPQPNEPYWDAKLPKLARARTLLGERDFLLPAHVELERRPIPIDPRIVSTTSVPTPPVPTPPVPTPPAPTHAPQTTIPGTQTRPVRANLTNQSKNCYASSAIQSLANTPGLVATLVDINAFPFELSTGRSDVITREHLGLADHRDVMTTLCSIISALETASRTNVPRIAATGTLQLIDNVRVFDKDFELEKENDPNEFLSRIIDIIDISSDISAPRSELTELEKLAADDKLGGEQRPIPRIIDKAWQGYLQLGHDSPITHNTAIQVIDEWKCGADDCAQPISRSYAAQSITRLEFPDAAHRKDRSFSVEDLLRRSNIATDMDHQPMSCVQYGDNHPKTTKRFRKVVRTPSNLILSVNRKDDLAPEVDLVRADEETDRQYQLRLERSSQFISNSVQLSDSLDLAPFCSAALPSEEQNISTPCDGQTLYRLHAIIEYGGAHLITYARTRDSAGVLKWTLFNDGAPSATFEDPDYNNSRVCTLIYTKVVNKASSPLKEKSNVVFDGDDFNATGSPANNDVQSAFERELERQGELRKEYETDSNSSIRSIDTPVPHRRTTTDVNDPFAKLNHQYEKYRTQLERDRSFLRIGVDEKKDQLHKLKTLRDGHEWKLRNSKAEIEKLKGINADKTRKLELARRKAKADEQEIERQNAELKELEAENAVLESELESERAKEEKLRTQLHVVKGQHVIEEDKRKKLAADREQTRANRDALRDEITGLEGPITPMAPQSTGIGATGINKLDTLSLPELLAAIQQASAQHGAYIARASALALSRTNQVPEIPGTTRPPASSSANSPEVAGGSSGQPGDSRTGNPSSSTITGAAPDTRAAGGHSTVGTVTGGTTDAGRNTTHTSSPAATPSKNTGGKAGDKRPRPETPSDLLNTPPPKSRFQSFRSRLPGGGSRNSGDNNGKDTGDGDKNSGNEEGDLPRDASNSSMKTHRFNSPFGSFGRRRR